MATEGGGQEANGPQQRIMLVVVDDSPEMDQALVYACARAGRTEGRVALLRVMEPVEFQQWMAVAELIQEENREAAEQLLQRAARRVNEMTGTVPILYVREGETPTELIRLLEEEPSISVLVLASSASNEGPGPLVSYLTGKGRQQVRIPITLIPTGLSEEEIEALA